MKNGRLATEHAHCSVDSGLDGWQAVANDLPPMADNTTTAITWSPALLGDPGELAIFQARPTLVSDSEHFVSGERIPQPMRKVLVEQDLHETGCSRSACANSIRRMIAPGSRTSNSRSTGKAFLARPQPLGRQEAVGMSPSSRPQPAMRAAPILGHPPADQNAAAWYGPSRDPRSRLEHTTGRSLSSAVACFAVRLTGM